MREASDRHKPHCFELYASGTDFIKACKTDSEGKVVEGPWVTVCVDACLCRIEVRRGKMDELCMLVIKNNLATF